MDDARLDTRGWLLAWRLLVRSLVSSFLRSVTAKRLRLGDGRELPPLLFATSERALRRAIGHTATRHALATIADRAEVVSDLPEGATVRVASRCVGRALAAHREIRGVVLLGGPSIVPAQRLATVPAAFGRLDVSSDADRFVVWSDDVYGDLDRDGLPELPVSRIPDGGSARLLLRQLVARAARRRPRTRSGLRNVLRPYADDIFATLPGAARMLTSTRTVYDEKPPYDLTAEQIYLVLHGDAGDGTRGYGESASGDYPIALALRNVPRSPAVVLNASCWGALIVDAQAMASGAIQPRPRTTRDSLALMFLDRGALAVIGCTGSHYSPMRAPYNYNGQPLHRAFWRRLARGAAPARALFEAKYLDYLPGIPHGPSDRLSQACELKVLHEFTCLGLGW